MLQCQGHAGLLDSWVFLVLLSPWLSNQSCKHSAKHIIQLAECLGHFFQRLIKKKRRHPRVTWLWPWNRLILYNWMLERLNIPMWVSSNQKMISLLVLSPWLSEAENHFLFISFWTLTNSSSVDSKICLWKKLLVQDTAGVYNGLKISYLKHNTFPSFLSMVLQGDSQALLTSIPINFHPAESGVLCKLPQYNPSVGFFGICITT